MLKGVCFLRLGRRQPLLFACTRKATTQASSNVKFPATCYGQLQGLFTRIKGLGASVFMPVCVLVSPGLLMTGVEGLFRYVCSLVMPEGGIWIGWVSKSLCLYKYALGPHSLAKMCLFVCACCMRVHVFVTPLQPNELEAITGQQGCYGDQWCQRGATSVGCLSRQVFLFLSLSPLSLPVSWSDSAAV